MPDIDIDFADRTKALEHFKTVTAAIKENGSFKKHNTGIYCTSVPYNPFTGISTIDYKEAEDRGEFFDDRSFLNKPLPVCPIPDYNEITKNIIETYLTTNSKINVQTMNKHKTNVFASSTNLSVGTV